MPKPRNSIVPIVLFAMLATGCVMRRPATAPKLGNDLAGLEEQLDTLPPFPEPVPESGSLWTSAGPGAALFRDTRAFRVNDLVTVVIAESTAGANQSQTDLKRSSEASFSAPYVFGSNNLTQVLDTATDTDFSGDGQTSRSSSLAGSITARVMRVLPNGDLIVAGQKTVVVNRDRQVLTLIGSVRPVDISSANRIRSSEVGELTVRVWGTGEVDATVRQGWFMRIMNLLWPF